MPDATNQAEKKQEFNWLHTWEFMLFSTFPQRGQNKLLKHKLFDLKIKIQMISNTYKGPILIANCFGRKSCEALRICLPPGRRWLAEKFKDEGPSSQKGGLKLRMHSGLGLPLLPEWERKELL